MNLREVELGGKKRKVRFGLKVIGDCIKHNNNDPAEFLGALATNPFETVPVVFYYGMKYDMDREGKKPDFDLLDVYEWLEEEGLTSEKVDDVTRAFVKSLYDNVPAIKEAIDKQPEEVKKNLIGI